MVLVLISGCKTVPPPPPPPPAPDAAIKIASAKTVFVSNLGSDPVAAANIPRGADAGYNLMYASLQRWGYFKLVTSPRQADLIFEIRSTKQHYDSEYLGPGSGPKSYALTTYPSITSLTIRNPADHSVLWETKTKFLDSGTPKGVYSRFDQAIEHLTTELKELVPAVPSMAPSTK